MQLVVSLYVLKYLHSVDYIVVDLNTCSIFRLSLSSTAVFVFHVIICTVLFLFFMHCYNYCDGCCCFKIVLLYSGCENVNRVFD